jgi:para-nitrobenzyl esterase
LNIFSPLEQKDNESFPVLFFFHGGTSSATIYPASRLANTTRSIVVSVQYRQGPFGYLVTPELLSTGAVNLASEDQLVALQWVKSSIGAFAGDSSKISIFGQSAGAGFVLWMLVWPKAYPLYTSAIIESTGGGGCAYKDTILSASQSFASAVGCKNDTSSQSQLDCLRQINATYLAAAGGKSIAIQCCDCGTIADSPAKLIKEGSFNRHVPVMIGCAAFEQAGSTGE